MNPLERLGHVIVRRRRWVILAWVGLTIFGVIGAGQVGSRWQQNFSIPGYSAYEANQPALKTLGTGERTPLVAVFQSKGDVTNDGGIAKAIAAAKRANPGSRVSSFYSTGSDAFVSSDRHTTFAEIYPRGLPEFSTPKDIATTQAVLQRSAPAGVTTHLTGIDPLFADQGGSSGPSLALEILIGGVGAVLVLLLVFGTLPAVLMPLVVAASSILTTFGVVWLVTYLTDVSIIVQFLIALVGLGVAIDYSLLMIFRFREELAKGEGVEDAIALTMARAGRSVVVSGSTVAIGLLSLLILPVPFIRAIGIGGMLIPAVSVLASITLLPAVLSKLGPRINSIRLLPRRFHAGEYVDTGFWGRWASLVLRRPGVIATIGLVIVGLLLIPASKLNPAQAQAKDMPGSGDAFAGRDALSAAGITAGVLEPYVVLVENGPGQKDLQVLVTRLDHAGGVTAADAPKGTGWRRGGSALVETFPSSDAESEASRGTIADLKDSVLPGAQAQVDHGIKMTLGGAAPENRDFVHAVYGNFPYVLAFVVALTFLLLARAFRSLLLPLKAVILNLISLAAAYGIVVFIFQEGHGAQAIWNVAPTQAIISWIPLMIFAFLFGLSMDYEVFMLTRMREVYDSTGSTPESIRLGG